MPQPDPGTRFRIPRIPGGMAPTLPALLLFIAGGIPASAAAQEDAIEELVVLGSRGGERALLDSMVPVDRFTAQELDGTFATGNELGEALATLDPEAFHRHLLERAVGVVPGAQAGAMMLRDEAADAYELLASGEASMGIVLEYPGVRTETQALSAGSDGE
jgi:hypothetical protein